MKKLILIIIAFSALIVSCEKDEPNTNSDSVLTKANVRGELALFDEYGNAVTKERMFVLMTSSLDTYWGETEKDGSFLVPNVPYSNNYSISYEKDGFGTYKKFGYKHEYTGQEGSIGSVNLGKKSTAYNTSLFVSQSNDTTHFHLSLAGGSNSGKRRVRLLFHNIPEISNSIFSHYTSKFQTNNPQPMLSLSKEYLLNEVGLTSGETYYVKAFGESYFSNAYFDEEQLKQVLPNLGWSETEGNPKAVFIMP
jgi:hypothetical protein